MEELTASERFSNVISGKATDRLPVIEWAPWWDKTVTAWKNEGLSEQNLGYEELQGYFGLDKCIQTCVQPMSPDTPNAPGFGLG